MLELVTSNFPPLKTENKNFQETFMLNISKAARVVIACGYISQDSLVDLYRFLKVNGRPKIDIIIGMHYFEGLTVNQSRIIQELQLFMKASKLGNIYFATVSKYHGKVYLFYDEDGFPNEVLIGSSNLNSILPTEQIYETDIQLVNEPINEDIEKFIFNLRDKYCSPYTEIYDDLKIKEQSLIFENHLGVEKISQSDLDEIYGDKTDTIISIPLKVSKRQQRSNLNACHGAGRENKATGTIIPRPWYEIELIVPKDITSHAEYPEKQRDFTVYTDDGWKFQCRVSGDYKKNFRSKNDLTILGKWIKGRLENKGVLRYGEVITESTLLFYGRNNFDLIKTNINDTWIIEFGV